MKKKFTVLCSAIIALSVFLAAFGVNGSVKTDITTATAKIYYAENNESTTKSSLGDVVGGVVGGIGGGSSGLGDSLGNIGDGSLGDSLGNISGGSLGDSLGDVGSGLSGGIGDALGGIGDSLGNILGGLGGAGQKTTAPVQTTAADIGLIIPVPAATQTPSETQATSAPAESLVAGETVDYAATSNPYTKPTASFSAGDEDETIKWLQWIFIYTHYGLKDDGITGVLDEDTVAIVKKLQHENDLTVDGNITEAVIKAAEVLYYQSVLGGDVSAIEVSSQATSGVSVSYEAVKSEGENDIPVALLVAILVIIWVIAIGGIVLLFLFKKKKFASQKATDQKTEENKSESKEIISSIADLFEEADRKSK